MIRNNKIKKVTGQTNYYLSYYIWKSIQINNIINRIYRNSRLIINKPNINFYKKGLSIHMKLYIYNKYNSPNKKIFSDYNLIKKIYSKKWALFYNSPSSPSQL